MQIAQCWPKSQAKFGRLIRVLSRNTGPSCAIWANPVKVALLPSHTIMMVPEPERTFFARTLSEI
jgi:hypothetical protein